MTSMNHQDVRELLALAALDALSPEDAAAVTAHIAWCAECRHELASLRDTAAKVGGSMPPRPMPAGRQARVRERLMSRAKADGQADPAPPMPMRASRSRWLLAASLLLATGLTVGYLAGNFSGARDTAALEARFASQIGAMHAQLAERQATLDALTGPGVKVINAAAAGVRQPYARMFWDQPANQWTFVAYNLAATAPGRTYQLWLITKDQKKISAGTFAPAPNGNAFVKATFALASDSLVAIAVTDEPSGGSKQPTSTPFLVGAAGK